jgi:predicted transposase/invertase (TIGR01784 family)
VLGLMTAVLEPKQPITAVDVLNPELSKESVAAKGAILDVMARVRDGTQANVEMQARPHRGLPQRGLFYWAKAYTDQLGAGEHYYRLAPTHSVFILNFVELETQRYHSVFRLLEVEEHVVLTEDLAIHMVELPKLPERPPDGRDPVDAKVGEVLRGQDRR